MGLFSFIGKAVKGVGKLVGTAAKIGSSLGIIPGGGLIGKAANVLLASKRPMATTGIKLSQRDPRLMRGNVTQGGYGGWATAAGNRPPPAVLRMSPVMPGGAVATGGGMAPRSSSPPSSFGGSSAAPKRRKKSATGSRKRASSGRKRRGRKLKFGSPAWRKKYLGHGRKKRRRAA